MLVSIGAQFLYAETRRQQGREPRSWPDAVEFGVTNHGERPSREQATQITIASLADIAETSAENLKVV